MSLHFLAVATLLKFCFCSEEPNYPELNPEFQSFQDMSKGFPLTETWYILYRNYEDDPVFGTDKCVRFNQENPATDGEYPVTFKSGEDSEPINTKIMLEPSEGYTVTNRIILSPEGQSDTLTVYTAYMDPDAKCGVTRNLYVSDTACCVAVPESQLENQLISCDFIYYLLCGTNKIQIHDDSC
ncbi:conserved hypothetical protein [Ixodes scapularis]|uniref:Salivary lipocalin n=1 Tax=Ixodes scapularis TaxID=6945 RepID=B7PAK0_IXOSC|nr:conserved hypothetical protein [Ixodes scapularis]|eukprot:XP_002406945.1 conserved hypothetical protein [Ixodes scapularis]